MDLASIPTAELVEAARAHAKLGEIPQGVLNELGVRYVYRECPAEDKAMIADFDRTVVIPLLGSTKLPPETKNLPGANLSSIPIYYQNQQPKDSKLRETLPTGAEIAGHTTAEGAPGIKARKVARAFISYSHKDAELLTQLHEHLSALKRQQLLDTWTDREIHPGGIIDYHVDEEIEKADLFLVLVSSAFIQSEYCFQKEFGRACERQRAGEATIVPIIVRECDWGIPQLRQFKALPEDGKAVMSRNWHTPDEAFANIAAGLRALLERGQLSSKRPLKGRKPPKEKFTPDERHVNEAQRAELRKLCDEIVDRLTARVAAEPDDEVKRKKGRYFGIVWSQFNEHFGISEHGLPSLPREHFEAAKCWLLQYRASKDKNLKRTNPQKYRDTLTKTIYTLLGKLGWTKDQLYAFASQKVGYPEPISSLNSLGNSQLELVRDRIRYEHTKRTAKAGQAKARQG